MLSKKNLKLIMELIFIFILPLIFMCFTSEIQVERNFVYDNEGNYQVSEDSKNLSFDNSIIKYTNGYKNTIDYFNLWNEEVFRFNESLSLSTGGSYTNTNALLSNFIKIDNTKSYYIYYGQGTNAYVDYYTNDNISNFISGEAISNNLNIPSNAEYLRFSIQNYGQSYNNNICLNYDVSWANGNYVPYNETLILYTSTDVSGQNDIVYTIWGNIKNIVIDYLDVNDNVLLDILLCYLFLWFFMFLIWHTFYRFFDWIFHLSLVGGKDNG